MKKELKRGRTNSVRFNVAIEGERKKGLPGSFTGQEWWIGDSRKDNEPMDGQIEMDETQPE